MSSCAGEASSIDKQNSLGWSPLCLAVHLGLLSNVRDLLSAGASVDQQDQHGCTPLYAACFHGHTR